VRVGAHPEEGGFDRIVFEFSTSLPAARVEYVSSVVQCGSGNPVAVPGTPLLVTFEPADAHTQSGQPTFVQEVVGPGNSILLARQVCDFEAQVQWVISVDGRQPFRVTTLDAPSRLVIDVKH
jgi:hypothetical protein